jgi:hypothetical protein
MSPIERRSERGAGNRPSSNRIPITVLQPALDRVPLGGLGLIASKFDADASYHPMIVLSNLFRRVMQYMIWGLHSWIS